MLRTIEDNYIDSIVTDPPYGISFMGKHWDYDVPKIEVWVECLRVLKPGGHILCACGTRTQHRMAVNIEDAGFEIRDLVAWIYGSGFPKSLNIGKQDGCEHMEGWGTALKPAMELWTLARKPLIGTVAENVMRYSTGGINVDGCRVEGEIGSGVWGASNKSVNPERTFVGSPDAADYRTEQHPLGRFPANVIHDGSEEVVAGFPNSGNGNGNGSYNYAGRVYDNKDTSMFNGDKPQAPSNFNDSGSAARFFKCCPQEIICPFCLTTIDEHDIMSSCKNTNAPNAEKNLKTSQAITGNTALPNVTQNPSELIAQSVKSAGNLCGSCATVIAQSLVAMRQGQDPALVHGWDFISERKKQILIKCLASFVEILGNTDTTPTMDSLNLLFGYVFHAIENYTEPISERTDTEICRSSRLKYCAKASKAERDEGLYGMDRGEPPASARSKPAEGRTSALGAPRANNHPTVKPLALMQYLCRLITPTNGTVLDPFAGSGSTLIAAKLENFNYIGIEREPEYCKIAEARLKAHHTNKKLEFVS